MRDKNGRQIMSGDLVRTPHFRAAKRRQQFYLYHVVTKERGEDLYITPASWLCPQVKRNGGQCLLTTDLASACEIIDGYGGGKNFWADRPEKRDVPPPPGAGPGNRDTFTIRFMKPPKG